MTPPCCRAVGIIILTSAAWRLPTAYLLPTILCLQQPKIEQDTTTEKIDKSGSKLEVNERHLNYTLASAKNI
jgi:hypothetical protein